MDPNRKTTYQHLAEADDLSRRTFEDWPVFSHTVAFPPALLMGSSGSHRLQDYLVAGTCLWQMLTRYLPPDARVLDIGCGCAKLARFLASDPRVADYVGFDPIAACIEWNRRYVLPISGPRFRFEHIDLYSAEYNPHGKVDPDRLAFPVATSGIDVVVAASVFTHLLEPTARHYLAQSARVLKPGGKLVLSVHIEPPAGQRYAGDEARIDVDPEYFLGLAVERGLSLHEALGEFCGQQMLILERD